jgi:hypothetical protein
MRLFRHRHAAFNLIRLHKLLWVRADVGDVSSRPTLAPRITTQSVESRRIANTLTLAIRFVSRPELTGTASVLHIRGRALAWSRYVCGESSKLFGQAMGHDFCPQYLLVTLIRYVVRQRPVDSAQGVPGTSSDGVRHFCCESHNELTRAEDTASR